MMAEPANRVNAQAKITDDKITRGDKIACMQEFDDKPERLDRYEDPKLETLGELLDQLSGDGTMDIEELDGFFAALHCCPQLVPPSEYLQEIFGTGESLEGDEFFNTPETAKLVFGLLMHHWNAVGDVFRTENVFVPLLQEDDDGKARGNNWCIGFMRGVEMREEFWAEILDDEQRFDWLVPILALAEEEDPDPEAPPETEALTNEERERLLAQLCGSVMQIYRHFLPHRQLNASAAAIQSGFDSKTKIGRNDPCYCGSGLKYKKCCGALRVN
jgi:uncharacterized protein